ncbi:37S ribosomal protein S23 mitochondrial [Lobosporangium transversale]|uniref:Small ribosomal subunit protein mS29 n=1 Tax=Lobosporangium transversale TaxID=64571 RepID=A0A1Y2GSM8_9FUNG|nr:mitochondrial ribosomal death-associated protein 3-domain-containing protein [Lobosporangium transversale]KAF9897421.1 37S ribosomal protein S23 mitochondrial [Lobosporangium transversale]ORZ21795.1 mitochondrial ribosomal death-associated protein 3-domain-containing protein [Lobosporangium transversale]|eukprot:XP_021883046.1 mitochondrial ribosomal death-associated protein 3-domain-containing protein [Lobosporangium transversale]
MAHRLLTSTSLLPRTQQTLAARIKATVPVQYANYVTASAVVSAAVKAKKGAAPTRAKGHSNSFRKKGVVDDDSNEGATGAGRLNEKYYKAAIPVKVEEFLPSTATKDNIGKVLGIPSVVTPALSQTAFPTFLNEQFALVKSAALVVRESTVDLLERVDKAMKTPSAQSRIVLTGESGSGKSAVLLQAVSHCLSAGWVVIYVPKASTWMNSSFAYNKVPGSTSFVQPLLASNVAGQIHGANKSTLNGIVVSENAMIGHQEVAKGTTLSALLEIAVKNQFAAQDVMELFLKELGAQKGVPTLIAVDEINTFFRPTEYLNQDAKALNPEHLKLPNLFLRYISGKNSLSHGAIVTATSETHWPRKSETLDVSLGVKVVSPYKKLSQTILPWTQGFTRFEVPNYTRPEAKGVFNYYKKGNIIYDAPSEALFLNKFITSGGNPRKFFTACAKEI